MQRILVSRRANQTEQIAAHTLQTYLRRISGRDISTITTPDDQTETAATTSGTVLVGTPSTHPIIARLVNQKRIPDPCSQLRPEGFLLKTLPEGPGGVLVITGADGKGVLNGVYDLLEDQFGVGFFRDGERLSEEKNLKLAPLEILESPRHSLRGELLWGYLGPQRFCSSTWSLASWQRVIDWQAQKKMNLIELSLPLKLIFPTVFPDLEWTWGGPWTAEFTRQQIKDILAYGRARGIKFLYEFWYTRMAARLKQAYPHLLWHQHFLCASQPECQAFTRRIWQATLEEFGTDHLYTLRYRGEEGMPYSPVCRELPKWQGYLQAYQLLCEIDPQARISAWSWAEMPEQLWPRLPSTFECQHMKHRLSGEWRFPGLGRDVPPGRPPIPPGTKWYNAIFYVFSGTETKLLSNLSDARYLVEDARLSAQDPACDGYLVWPEWTNTNYFLWDLLAELAWDPERFDLSAHTVKYTLRRYGPAAAEAMTSSLNHLIEAGRSRYIYTPSRRNVVLWHLSSQHLGQMHNIHSAIQAAARVFSQQRGNPLYETTLLDLVSYYLYQSGWYYEAKAYFHHQQAIQAKREGRIYAFEEQQEALHEAGSKALQAWDDLFAVYRPRDDYSLQYSAQLMQETGPVTAGFVDQFIHLSTEYYHGYPLCSSQEEVYFFLRPQCAQLIQALEKAIENGQPYTSGEPARWFWYDFAKPWKVLVYGMPFPDPEVFRARFREALDSGQPLLPQSDETPIEALQRVMQRLIQPDRLQAYDLVSTAASETGTLTGRSS